MNESSRSPNQYANTRVKRVCELSTENSLKWSHFSDTVSSTHHTLSPLHLPPHSAWELFEDWCNSGQPWRGVKRGEPITSSADYIFITRLWSHQLVTDPARCLFTAVLKRWPFPQPCSSAVSAPHCFCGFHPLTPSLAICLGWNNCRSVYSASFFLCGPPPSIAPHVPPAFPLINAFFPFAYIPSSLISCLYPKLNFSLFSLWVSSVKCVCSWPSHIGRRIWFLGRYVSLAFYSLSGNMVSALCCLCVYWPRCTNVHFCLQSCPAQFSVSGRRIAWDKYVSCMCPVCLWCTAEQPARRLLLRLLVWLCCVLAAQ